MIDQLFFITTMPTSRPADYYLGYMDGCVFLDFNNYNDDRIYLKRISFDGYGCYDLETNWEPLDTEDSKTFKDIIKTDIKDQEKLLRIVKKAISLNQNFIRKEALEEYYLI